jgi:hypothetical protein
VVVPYLRAHDDGGHQRYSDEADLGGRAAVTIDDEQDVAANAHRWNDPHHSLSGFAQRRRRRISIRCTIARTHKDPMVGDRFDQYANALSLGYLAGFNYVTSMLSFYFSASA